MTFASALRLMAKKPAASGGGYVATATALTDGGSGSCLSCQDGGADDILGAYGGTFTTGTGPVAGVDAIVTGSATFTHPGMAGDVTWAVITKVQTTADYDIVNGDVRAGLLEFTNLDNVNGRVVYNASGGGDGVIVFSAGDLGKWALIIAMIDDATNNTAVYGSVEGGGWLTATDDAGTASRSTGSHSFSIDPGAAAPVAGLASWDFQLDSTQRDALRDALWP